MFKDSEKGLNKTHHYLGVLRVRSILMMNHANEVLSPHKLWESTYDLDIMDIICI
jgi:hypothetical protein